MTDASMQGAHLPVDDAVVAAAFRPVEAAIARIALELPAAPGDDQLDLWNKSGILEDGVVHLEEGDDSAGANDLARSASDALARLVLAGFEGTLPVWGLVTKTEVTVTRKDRARRRQAVRAMPMLLLEVNWADSGPGFLAGSTCSTRAG